MSKTRLLPLRHGLALNGEVGSGRRTWKDFAVERWIADCDHAGYILDYAIPTVDLLCNAMQS